MPSTTLLTSMRGPPRLLPSKSSGLSNNRYQQPTRGWDLRLVLKSDLDGDV